MAPLPEKLRLLQVAIGDHANAGQLLKTSTYEFRYLDPEPEQASMALLMPARARLTWQDGDLFPPMDQNLPEGDLFMKIRQLFPKQPMTPMHLLALIGRNGIGRLGFSLPDQADAPAPRLLSKAELLQTRYTPEVFNDLMAAYYRRLTGSDRAERERCAIAWSSWEGETVSIQGPSGKPDKFADPEFAVAFARIENWYFTNGGFFDSEHWILENIETIRHIPCWIAQGRFDVVTPISGAWSLHRAWPEAKLDIIGDAGHASSEPGIIDSLIRATDWAATL